jgi:MIP family channel proteins
MSVAASVEYVVMEEPEPRGATAYLAEAIGTFVLVLAICGTISAMSGSGGVDLVGVALAHAFALAAIIYTIGGASGAHVNPAVTIGLWAIKKISGANAIAYIVCQAIGAILAALVVLLLFNDAGETANYGAAAINPDVLQGGSAWLGLIAEALGTFILVWAVMGLAVNPRGEAPLGGLGIGVALGVGVLIFGSATGASLNPARWLGPAIAAGEFSDFWLYILGPIIGGLAATLGYRALLLTGRGLPAERPKDELPG